MKLKPDHRPTHIEPGSAVCTKKVRKPDQWLRLEIEAQRKLRAQAWAEARHIKQVEKLELELLEGRGERARGNFWLRMRRATTWGENGKRARRMGTSASAIRTVQTGGALPRYSKPIRDRRGLLFPFQRTIYANARNSKPGHARELVQYGIEGALELDTGRLAYASNMGLTPGEIAAAFDLVETVNRSSAANAKTVHHMIIQSIHDLPIKEQWEMAKRYCDYVFGQQDLPYSLAMHAPDPDGDERNFHFHVVFSYRPMVREAEGEWQVGRFLRTDLDTPEQWTRMRFLLAEEFNYTCERAGLAKRYTHLSYAASGIDAVPQTHLGPGLTAKVRRGEHVAINVRNHRTAARNMVAQALQDVKARLRSSVAAVAAELKAEVATTRAAIDLASRRPERPMPTEMLRGLEIPSPLTSQAARDGSNSNAANEATSSSPARQDIEHPLQKRVDWRIPRPLLPPRADASIKNAPVSQSVSAQLPIPLRTLMAGHTHVPHIASPSFRLPRSLQGVPAPSENRTSFVAQDFELPVPIESVEPSRSFTPARPTFATFRVPRPIRLLSERGTLQPGAFGLSALAQLPVPLQRESREFQTDVVGLAKSFSIPQPLLSLSAQEPGAVDPSPLSERVAPPEDFSALKSVRDSMSRERTESGSVGDSSVQTPDQESKSVKPRTKVPASESTSGSRDPASTPAPRFVRGPDGRLRSNIPDLPPQEYGARPVSSKRPRDAESREAKRPTEEGPTRRAILPDTILEKAPPHFDLKKRKRKLAKGLHPLIDGWIDADTRKDRRSRERLSVQIGLDPKANEIVQSIEGRISQIISVDRERVKDRTRQTLQEQERPLDR